MKTIHRKNQKFQNQLQFEKLRQNSRNAVRLYKLIRLLESLPESRRNEILGLLAFVVDAVKEGSSKYWLNQLLDILTTNVSCNKTGGAK